MNIPSFVYLQQWLHEQGHPKKILVDWETFNQILTMLFSPVERERNLGMFPLDVEGDRLGFYYMFTLILCKDWPLESERPRLIDTTKSGIERAA